MSTKPVSFKNTVLTPAAGGSAVPKISEPFTLILYKNPLAKPTVMLEPSGETKGGSKANVTSPLSEG